MSHIPVNHHLRPLYRVLAAVTGLYVLLFGIVGLAETSGGELFARTDTAALGLRTNLAFSLISILTGVILLISVFVGRNVDRFVYFFFSAVFLLAGMIMMTLMQTDSNVLNFSVATCVVSFLIGSVLGVAGLYGKVGSAEQAAAEEAFRHGGH
jgi:membrane-associated HD superfamily phosphohydrolase